MVDNSEDSDIKIVDFGLSKTFGPGETCNEPYGTLCYVAPEILMQLPQDKAVDCWSFGIIIYLMLGRHLPFDSTNDEEIGRKTIYKEINFNHPVWSTVSEEGKDLISKLLIKNRKDRINIKDALDHPWISGQDPAINNLRRKSGDAGNKLMEFIAYSHNNMRKIEDSSQAVPESSSLLQAVI